MNRIYLGLVTALFLTIIWYQYRDNQTRIDIAENESNAAVFYDCIELDKNRTIERIKEIEEDEKYHDDNNYSVGTHYGVF